MAKFGRFDPRNKKKDKHKYDSLNRDIRIRYEEPVRVSKTAWKRSAEQILERNLEETLN